MMTINRFKFVVDSGYLNSIKFIYLVVYHISLQDKYA